MNNMGYYICYVLGRLRRLYFMQIPENEKDNTKSLNWYIIDACTATTIVSMVGGAFLASLLKSLGVSDSVNGIVTAIASLGTVAQITGVFITRGMKKIKLFVCALALLHRTLFSLIFFIPFLNLAPGVRTAGFVLSFALGHIIGNIINPPASNWLGSLINPRERGRYLAKRDLWSILSVMVITMGYSLALDRYKLGGNEKTGFYIGGILVFVLAIVNFIALTLIKEPRLSYLNKDNAEMHGRILKRSGAAGKKESFAHMLKTVFRDRNFRAILLINSVWNLAFYLSAPYFGIYQVKELGLSYTYIMAVAFGANVVRIIATPFLGRFADSRSWGRVLEYSLLLYGAGFLIYGFAVPYNGKVIFLLFTVIASVASPGINLGFFNMIFESTAGDDKTPYFGVNSALNGVTGFVSAVFGGALLKLAGDGRLPGVSLYGQQFLSFISAAILLALVALIRGRLSAGKYEERL